MTVTFGIYSVRMTYLASKNPLLDLDPEIFSKEDIKGECVLILFYCVL